MRDPRYDVLFEPLRIGPVTTKNRFYQVPHCTGMGWARADSLAAMRGVKAEGGWGVVCTEYCSIHATSDDGPYPHARLWNADHIRANRKMTDAVHEHGALAGAELWIGGGYVSNLDSREPPIGLRGAPPTNSGSYDPVQSRRADKSDLRDIRQWHADAARRAVEAGFDIVYVYATHGYLLSEFLDPTYNDRTDEYGGSLENRVRLIRELIEDTAEAVAGRCAVAVRFSVDLADAETFDAFGLLASMPDLWDLTVPDYGIEMGASRFVREASLRDSVAAAKQLTDKPVVAVGRFTSPDTMVSVIRDGTQDMIGAARPSIADPFLPKKIESGRIEDIRECIGCNTCYAHDFLGVPIRCTQNPTMGEEYRRGWHPERVAPAKRKDRVLVIGAGPAGLEAARVCGERGFETLLAESGRDLGGRVTLESRLPGLSEWARVRDWRIGQIEKNPNIEVFRESEMTADDARAVGADRVIVATGATWAEDGIGRSRTKPIELGADAVVVGPDAILAEAEVPGGRVVLYDDDHYYLGSVIALLLRREGVAVTLVTPAGRACEWAMNTQEQFPAVSAMLSAGVEIVTDRVVERMDKGVATLASVYGGPETKVEADWLLPITRRVSRDGLFHSLRDTLEWGDGSLLRAGDCDAPSTIAAAVYAGYKCADAL
jgi:dimethylamine/trimethylamine dehydrogenase